MLEAVNDLKTTSACWFRGDVHIGGNHLLLFGAEVQLARFHYGTLVLVVLKEELPLCLIADNFRE